MDISLNGKPQRIDDASTIAVLLEALSLHQKRLAVEVNGDVVPRSQHAGWVLNPGDRVEIVHAIGGG